MTFSKYGSGKLGGRPQNSFLQDKEVNLRQKVFFLLNYSRGFTVDAVETAQITAF